MAASTALPPARRMRAPASVASGLAAATAWRWNVQPGLAVRPEAPSGCCTDEGAEGVPQALSRVSEAIRQARRVMAGVPVGGRDVINRNPESLAGREGRPKEA